MRGAGSNKNSGPTNLNINKQGDPNKWVVGGYGGSALQPVETFWFVETVQ